MLPIVIIGGGPAGAAAAWRLARDGRAVIIAESRTFPRAKVCGEFITPAAMPDLLRIAPLSRLRAAGARDVTSFVLEFGAHERSIELGSPGLALSRAVLDTIMLDAAAQAGAEVRTGASIATVSYGSNDVSLEFARGSPIAAAAVVHADGSGRLDSAGPVARDTNLIGHKCHLGPNAPAFAGVRIRACDGAYVGSISVEGGRSTLALASRRNLTTRFGGDIDALVRSLWPAFEPEWRDGPWMSSPVPRSRYVRPGHPRSFRVGNAAGAVDPVGGEGIGLALWSGMRAGELLADADWSHIGSLERAEARLRSLYRARLRARLPVCRLAAWALMRPPVIRALWPLIDDESGPLDALLRLSGKRAPAAPFYHPACP